MASGPIRMVNCSVRFSYQTVNIPWFLRKFRISFLRDWHFQWEIFFLGLLLPSAEHEIENESPENVETRREHISAENTLINNACFKTNNQSLLKIDGKPLY
jgi:hypothetical protein